MSNNNNFKINYQNNFTNNNHQVSNNAVYLSNKNKK